MGNGVTLNLSKIEEESFKMVQQKIATATNYKALLKSINGDPVDPKNPIDSLATDNIEYSKINAISMELSDKIRQKKKPPKEK